MVTVLGSVPLPVLLLYSITKAELLVFSHLCCDETLMGKFQRITVLRADVSSSLKFYIFAISLLLQMQAACNHCVWGCDTVFVYLR